MKWLQQKLKKYGIVTLLTLMLILLSLIPLRIAIASYQAPHPQAILTLGGGIDREEFTAKFAQNHPNLDIWVSSGINPESARAIFRNADIATSRLHLDDRAVDTVTNFTTLVADFQQRQIHHVYLITSNFHMPRAKAIARSAVPSAIATVVLGSQGITFTPVSIPSNQPRESMFRIVRDTGRSLMWIVSGRTGASLNPRLNERLYAFR